MQTFAEAATLASVDTESEIGNYFLTSWLEELKKIDRNLSNESNRSYSKLAQFVEDTFGEDYASPRMFRRALSFMSHDLRNMVEKYGLTRRMLRGL